MFVLKLDWKENPITAMIATSGLRIQEIPFPSVTICPNGFHKQKLDAVVYEKYADLATKLMVID